MSSNHVAVTLTVSRAHIVVKRLRTRAVECFDKADIALASFRVAETSSASAQATQRSAAIREEAVSLLVESEEFELAAAKLRAEIGAANVRFGTSERMSMDIALGTIANRLSGLARKGASCIEQRGSSYSRSDILYSDEFPYQESFGEVKRDRVEFISVTPFNQELVERLERQIEALKFDRMHKADDNGDANRQTISLRLPERVAKYAGLIRSA